MSKLVRTTRFQNNLHQVSRITFIRQHLNRRIDKSNKLIVFWIKQPKVPKQNSENRLRQQGRTALPFNRCTTVCHSTELVPSSAKRHVPSTMFLDAGYRTLGVSSLEKDKRSFKGIRKPKVVLVLMIITLFMNNNLFTDTCTSR